MRFGIAKRIFNYYICSCFHKKTVSIGADWL